MLFWMLTLSRSGRCRESADGAQAEPRARARAHIQAVQSSNFLGTNYLCIATTFFRKQTPNGFADLTLLPNLKIWNHSQFQDSLLCAWILWLFLSIYVTKDWEMTSHSLKKHPQGRIYILSFGRFIFSCLEDLQYVHPSCISSLYWFAFPILKMEVFNEIEST